MENNTIRINPDKLYTKSKYSEEFSIGRVTLDKRIKDKKVKTLKVKGTTLVIAE